MQLTNLQLMHHLHSIFNDEYDDYIKLLDEPLHKSLLCNTAYPSKDDIPFEVNDNAFALNHYTYDPTIHLSDYALFHAGAWYSQEASAASAVTVLDPRPGDYIVDCCAAPGGKSLQIAQKIGEKGLLISNEYDSKRANILAENIDNFGLTNTIVTQGDVNKLSHQFNQCFDKVLVDAPCSGEGMIRKEPMAESQWSMKLVEQCARLQTEILDQAATMVKPDGILVYSTCTFAIEENERQILAFLKSHPDFQLEPINVAWGRKGFAIDEQYDLTKTRRIFPMDSGEGHFIAKLKRINGSSQKIPMVKSLPINKALINQIESWYHGSTNGLYIDQDHLCYTQSPWINTKGLHVCRKYLRFGEILKNRIDPSFPASHCPMLFDAFDTCDVDIETLNTYLSGHPIASKGSGWQLVRYKNYGFGWIKVSNGIGKNHYPKSKRIFHTVI